MFRRSPTLWSFLREVYLPLHPGVSAGYRVQLETTVRMIERWHGGRLRIRDVSESLLRRFLAAYSEDRSPVTVNAKRRQLLTLCRTAHQEGLLGKVPEGVSRVREPRRIPDAWTVAQVSELVRYSRTLSGNVDGTARATYWSSLFSTAYWTGCRATALRLTQTSNCDLEAGWLLVQADVQKTDCDQLYQLSEQAVAELRPHFDERRRLIWPWPFHPRTFSLHVRRIMEAAGLTPSLRGMGLMQKLRRTAVTYVACESLELARRLAGHASVELTRRHYVDQRIAQMPSPADVLPKLDI